MKTRVWAIALMVVCTIFTSSAQILYKAGVNHLSFSIASILANWQIILGVAFYGFGAVLVVIALRGGDVTTLYPIIPSSYIWVTLGSSYFFGESVSVSRWMGIFLIVGGILVITLSDKEKNMRKVT